MNPFRYPLFKPGDTVWFVEKYESGLTSRIIGDTIRCVYLERESVKYRVGADTCPKSESELHITPTLLIEEANRARAAQ